MKYWLIVIYILAMGLFVDTAYSQNFNASKGEVMVQKWEYKFFYRSRFANPSGAGMYQASDWKYIEDGQKSLGTIDIIVKSKEMGEDGWELVDIASRSADPNFPGFTTEELWTFKRPKN